MMWPSPDEEPFSSFRRGFPRADDLDVRLTYEVADRLLSDARGRRQHVTVEVQNRVVVLTGCVDTQAESRMVAQIARHTGGVDDVCNALKVKRPDNKPGTLGDLRDQWPPGPGKDRDREVEEQRFQAIVAALELQGSSWTGRVVEPLSRAALIGVAVIVAVIWAIMSVLMVRFGWAGFAATCVVAGVALRMAHHRRVSRTAALRPSTR